MKVLQINTFGNLSTGRIAVDLYRTLRDNGHDGLFCFSRNDTDADVPHFKFGNKATVYADGMMTRLTDRAGFYSKVPTKKLIKKIEEYDPDIIHLHNLHGYYLNIELLFDYLKESGKPVVWTLHDCWATTGHCCHFFVAGCNRWKTGCHDCPQLNAYPASFTDASKENYRDKKRLFSGVDQLYLVTVSQWLEKVMQESFLCDKSIETIYNGIDLNVFTPTESDFRLRNGLEDKKIILGVASTWTKNKGLEDFVSLSKVLSDDYRIVLIGLSEDQMKGLPSNIIAFSRTDSVKELAEIYSAADVFFNASVEETFGLPTVEAMACGTPTVVYDATALPEVCTSTSGIVVKPHDISSVKEAIDRIQDNPLQREDIIDRARDFDREKQFMKYIDLYTRILGGVEGNTIFYIFASFPADVFTQEEAA